MKDLLVGALLMVAASAGIAFVQPGLGTAIHKYAKRDDIFVLPPPEQLKIMTLGYRAAGADMLWAKLVVEHGLHWEEKRPFPDMPSYIDAILMLDPEHPTLYDFIDTLLLFTPKGGTEDDARLARRYFEQGIKQRPLDQQVWLRYGQFMAFLSPSYIKDPKEVEEWKRAGALAIGRAVELGADPDHALSASTILGKVGERKGQIMFLQRAYALTDDPETRRQIKIKLDKLQIAVESEGALGVVEETWRTRFPFVSRNATLLLGPPRDPAACAGPGNSMRKECPRDWTDATRDAR